MGGWVLTQDSTCTVIESLTVNIVRLRALPGRVYTHPSLVVLTWCRDFPEGADSQLGSAGEGYPETPQGHTTGYRLQPLVLRR